MAYFIPRAVILFLVLAAWAASLVFVAASIDAWTCQSYADQTGRATEHRAFTCYVQDDAATWWTYGEFKLRNAATGGE